MFLLSHARGALQQRRVFHRCCFGLLIPPQREEGRRKPTPPSPSSPGRRASTTLQHLSVGGGKRERQSMREGEERGFNHRRPPPPSSEPDLVGSELRWSPETGKGPPPPFFPCVDVLFCRVCIEREGEIERRGRGIGRDRPLPGRSITRRPSLTTGDEEDGGKGSDWPSPVVVSPLGHGDREEARHTKMGRERESKRGDDRNGLVIAHWSSSLPLSVPPIIGEDSEGGRGLCWPPPH